MSVTAVLSYLNREIRQQLPFVRNSKIDARVKTMSGIGGKIKGKGQP